MRVSRSAVSSSDRSVGGLRDRSAEADVRREMLSVASPKPSVAAVIMNNSIKSFLLLTFTVTWGCYLAAAAQVTSGAQLSAVATALLYLGTFAPSLVAMSLAAVSSERRALATLVGKMFKARVGVRWYLFAIVYMVSIKGAAAIIQRVIAGEWPRGGGIAWYLLLAAVAISTPFQAGEELGWRGFLLPRMATQVGYRRASLFVGVVWALWHLPLFFIRGVDVFGQSFLLFTLAVIPLSVVLTWLYVKTDGSLLLTMVMHSAVNQTTLLFGAGAAATGDVLALRTSPFGWATIALLWAAGLFFLRRLPKMEQFVSAKASVC